MVHIFVSYSHLDRRWVDRKNPHNLIPFLAASLAREDVEIWYDPDLIAGELFRPAIEAQIDTAEIAIVLLSQDFFNSDFIRDVELPRIEARANAEGLQVIPILVGNCDWEELPVVGSRHILPGGPTPLIDFVGRDADWDRVRHEILQAVRRQLARLRTNPPQGTEPPDIAQSGVRTVGPPPARQSITPVSATGGTPRSPERPTPQHPDDHPRGLTIPLDQLSANDRTLKADENGIKKNVAAGSRSREPSPTVPASATPQRSDAVHGALSGTPIDQTPGFEPGDTPRSLERPSPQHPDERPRGLTIPLDQLFANDRTLKADRNGITSLAFSQGGALVTGSHTNATVWDLRGGTALRTLGDHSFWIYALAFSPDGETLAVGSYGRITLWAARTWTRLKDMEGHSDHVRSLAFSPDGEILASGAWRDPEVILWSPQRGARVGTIQAQQPGSGVQSLVFSPDGQVLAIGGEDGNVLLYEATSGRKVRVLPGDKASEGEHGVAFSPDGRILAAGSAGGVALWDVATAARQSLLEAKEGTGKCVAFSPDGGFLAGWVSPFHGNGYLTLWNVYTGARVGVSKYRGSAYSIAFSPDSRLLAVGIEGYLVLKEVGPVLLFYVPPEKETRAALEGERDEKLRRLRTRGEFESSTEYARRLESLKIEEPRLREEYDARTRQAEKRLAAQLAEKRRVSYPYSKEASLGKYDADAQSFKLDLEGHRLSIAVPREKARAMAEHRDRVRVEGMLRYYDGERVDLTDAVLVDPLTGGRYTLPVPRALGPR